MNRNIINYRFLLASNSVLSFALGLFMPFWIIFVQDFGGSIEAFGFAIGLMALAQAVTSYFAGKYSDRLGRKPFIIMAGFVTSGMIIMYTLITKQWHLYVLQVLNGITQAVEMTMEATMLADYTESDSRGEHIGKYHAATGILAAIAMMIGGYIVGQLGIKMIFYITAGLMIVSTVILFFIKEKE